MQQILSTNDSITSVHWFSQPREWVAHSCISQFHVSSSWDRWYFCFSECPSNFTPNAQTSYLYADLIIGKPQTGSLFLLEQLISGAHPSSQQSFEPGTLCTQGWCAKAGQPLTHSLLVSFLGSTWFVLDLVVPALLNYPDLEINRSKRMYRWQSLTCKHALQD